MNDRGASCSPSQILAERQSDCADDNDDRGPAAIARTDSAGKPWLRQLRRLALVSAPSSAAAQLPPALRRWAAVLVSLSEWSTSLALGRLGGPERAPLREPVRRFWQPAGEHYSCRGCMKRLLTSQTQRGLVGRPTAALAARRWGVAMEVRGGIFRNRLINRRWHGNLRRCGRLGGDFGRGRCRFESCEVRVKVRLEIGVDLRRCGFLHGIHVRLGRQVLTDLTIGRLTRLRFGKHRCRFAPSCLGGLLHDRDLLVVLLLVELLPLTAFRSCSDSLRPQHSQKCPGVTGSVLHSSQRTIPPWVFALASSRTRTEGRKGPAKQASFHARAFDP